MLTENDVVSAVCNVLEMNGYSIEQRLDIKQRGEDIIAFKESKYLSVEAKGGTSSQSHTKGFGKPFSPKQIDSHVARAFYKACLMLGSPLIPISERQLRVGMAFPDTSYHRRKVEAIKPIMMHLQIVLFWVKSIDEVEIESVWSL